MAIEDYYADVIARRVTETIDDIGGVVNTFEDTTIQALITQASSSEIDYANKIQVEASHNMYCDVSVDVDYIDKIVDGTKVYQIVSEPLNTVKRNHHYKILLKRLT